MLPLYGKTSAQQTVENIQQVGRFCATADELQIASSVIAGRPLLGRVPGQFTHLEIEREWLAPPFTVGRYDVRGIGLSERYHRPDANRPLPEPHREQRRRRPAAGDHSRRSPRVTAERDTLLSDGLRRDCRTGGAIDRFVGG